MIITATSNEDSSVSTTALLSINVQQNTHTITVNVQGLAPDVVTPLSVDNTFIENIGSGTVTLIISNHTKQIMVKDQINAGNSLYICLDPTQPADTGVNVFTFTYNVRYKLQLSADLPPDVVGTLTLKVNGADKTIPKLQLATGYSDYIDKGSTVQFAINSTINTPTLNYRFKGWTNSSTGNAISTTTPAGLFQISLNNPTHLKASFDQYVEVKIKTNLPSNMSTILQVGLVGENTKDLSVKGAAAYSAGQYLAGSAFQYDVSQDDLAMLNNNGDTRYEFQSFTPPSPITLNQHTTIQVNYAPKYRVRVLSRFPDTTLQPQGGVGWYAPGEVAILQVKPDATDNYGLPYSFDRWTGAISANLTKVTFPVLRPTDALTQWKINWIYLIELVAGAVAFITPCILLIRNTVRKVVTKRVQPNSLDGTVTKKPIQTPQNLTPGLSEEDMKLYDYIVANNGVLKFRECIKDLALTREQIDQSIENLKAMHMLT
jgi:hypothetical protein